MLAHLASIAARSLGLAALAFAALCLFRMKAAAARHAVWTLVTAGMLSMAVLAPVLPPVRVRVLRGTADRPAARAALAAEASQPGTVRAVPPAPRRRAVPWPAWPQLAVAVYAAGLLGSLARLALGYLFTRRLVGASQRVDRPWAREVYESAWISVPLTVGWLRPKVLLPPGWEQWPEDKLEAVLAHEQTHVRRADWAVALLAGLNRSVYWFHPLAWWLERQLSQLAEQACDDRVLLEVGTESYARALLDMAAAVKTGQGRLTWEGTAMAKTAEVRRRIERILDETRQIPRSWTGRRWAVLLACSLPLLYLAAAVQLAPAQAQAPRVQVQRQPGPGDVSLMEQYLATHPDDLEVRGQLITAYFNSGAREPRLRHILWVISNHPESNLAASVSRGITWNSTVWNDASDFARAADLWRQQAAIHSTDARVLANAAQFFAQLHGDLDEAERLLTAARAVEPNKQAWTDNLGKLYADAILGTLDNAAFANRARAQLESSTDGWLLFQTGQRLQQAGPGPMAELGERLMARSEQFGVTRSPPPAHSGWTARFSVTATDPSWPPPPAVDSSYRALMFPPPNGLLSPPHLLFEKGVLYPRSAQDAGLQGMVNLMVTIASDGTVSQIGVTSGDARLAEPAVEAVKQWRFKPAEENGSAVESQAEVVVAFVLPQAAAPKPAGTPIPQMIRVGARVQEAMLVNKVAPIYPDSASAAGLTGPVVLAIVIGADGHVESAEPADGHPLLAAAAVDAVKQWVYRPTLLNGVPVKVSTSVTVVFP